MKRLVGLDHFQKSLNNHRQIVTNDHIEEPLKHQSRIEHLHQIPRMGLEDSASNWMKVTEQQANRIDVRPDETYRRIQITVKFRGMHRDDCI